MTFDLLLKNFNVGHNTLLYQNSLNLQNSYTDREYEKEDAYRFWGQKVKGQVTFDLLLKNFNIGHNFFILIDRAFIFCKCVPYDKAFPIERWILNVWPWLWPLTYF